MSFDKTAARAASLVFALAASLTGCGGGGADSSGDGPTASTTSTDSTQADVSSVSTGAGSDSDTQAITTDTQAMIATAPVDPSPTVDVSGATQGTTDSAVAAAGVTVAPMSVTGNPDTTVAVGGGATTVVSASGSVGATPRSGVGMNLTAVFSYSAEMPTIDLMKKASPWITQCKAGGACANFAPGASAYDTREEASLQVDAAGWVKSLPAATDAKLKFRTVTTKLAESAVQQAGNYVVVYDGKGTITYSGAGKKDTTQSSANRDVVVVENSDNNPLYLNITATDPTNYIRNIRVYMPGGACQNTMSVYAPSASACDAASGKFVPFESFPASANVWHPTFLASLKGFRTLRFMDWAKTNSTPIADWSDRTPVASRTWNMPSGVPLESMFDLAAKVGADPWMNIPPYATDAYVKSFAQLAHAHLAPNAKLALEYGNEMWNYSFAATKWSQLQSKATFAAQSAAGASDSVLQLNWYALRLAQVCKIVKTEFGADASRVQCVANTQAANSWNTNQVLQCTYAKAILGQPCAKFFDAVAIAPYFGQYIDSSKTTVQVASWAGDTDGGLTKLFLEINGTSASASGVTPLLATLGASVSGGAVAQVAGWMSATKTVADSYGLPMWAYEGGQSLIPTSGTTTMINLMAAANRDPRMGTAYQTMMADWRAAGGQTFVLFADVGVYGKSGMWGLRENQFDTNTPKWKVAAQYRDSACWWRGC